MPSRNGDPSKSICEPDNTECYEEAETNEEGKDRSGHLGEGNDCVFRESESWMSSLLS